jgi:hypothetical protein
MGRLTNGPKNSNTIIGISDSAKSNTTITYTNDTYSQQMQPLVISSEPSIIYQDRIIEVPVEKIVYVDKIIEVPKIDHKRVDELEKRVKDLSDRNAMMHINEVRINAEVETSSDKIVSLIKTNKECINRIKLLNDEILKANNIIYEKNIEYTYSLEAEKEKYLLENKNTKKWLTYLTIGSLLIGLLIGRFI